MRTLCLFILMMGLAQSSAIGQTTASLAKSSQGKYAELIPQNLLRLVHAPEVHRELGLSAQQVARLEAFFAQVDGYWFRSRVLPLEKQRAIMAELEGKLRSWLAANTTADQRQRLQQIEYRSLGVRMLLREDLSQAVGLDATQLETLATLANATNEATLAFNKASMTREGASEELRNALVTANAAEQEALKSVIRPEQMQTLSQKLGPAFDTTGLERIYPMAPEFVPVEHWINSQATTLKDLRGKVVIVHFYAFQCHNCHANFGHYQKWHDEFSSDQVAVVGIQTPETNRERDPSAVREAAAEKGLRFPVMVDLQSENWKAWANTMWPTVYVIDQRGYIRYVWQGELNWNGATQDQIIHDLVVKLLNEEAA